MDYSKRPGKKLDSIGILKKEEKATISVITPFYNGGSTIEETLNGLLSQTYPFFEWIIVDDGSKDKKSLKKLDEIAKLDKRIKVYHKENGGPAIARDYGIGKASKDTKYIFFLDCDDIPENTMLECLYWTLETHPEASFAYTTMVNFGDREFIWDQYLTAEREKRENLICISSLIRKDDLLEVNGFNIKGKALYEDWNLWLKLLAKGKIPIKVNAPIFWYRCNSTGEFSRAKKNNEEAMRYINETAKLVSDDAKVINFPREGKKYDTVKVHKDMVLPIYKKNDKTKILFILPWMVTGGADLFNLDLIKRLDKDKYEVIVLTTTPSENPLRQDFSLVCSEVYDMSTFLERSDYINFTDYIIESRNIDLVFVSNTHYGYYMVPYLKRKYPKIPFIDYIHSIDLADPREAFGRCSKDVDKYLYHTYCCNNFTKNQLLNNYDRSRVDTVYIGTDTNKFNPKKYSKDEMKEKYHIPKDKIIISFIARLSEEKRPSMFVEIGKRLLEERSDLHFVIAGDGYLFNDVSKEVTGDFSMLGMIKETAEIYALSDITINCSSLEGLALTSYESLAMGVPVVSTDVGGQTELIDEEVGGIVHYNKDASKEVYNEEVNNYCKETLRVLDNLEKLKKNCRKRIEEGFSLDKMALTFDKIFMDAIKDEKNNKVNYLDNDYTLYNLALETLFLDYYYYCKNYLEPKFGIIYDKDHKPKQRGRFYYQKQRLSEVLNRAHAKKEAVTILNVFRTLYQVLYHLMYFIKFLILSIPAFFVLVYKLITRNSD